MLPDFFPDVLERLTSNWKRRGTALLQIGAVRQGFPEIFRGLGFEVEALEDCRTEKMERPGKFGTEACRRRQGLLPYDDGEFDYAVLIFQGIGGSRISGENLLSEALRVSGGGVAVLEANALSPWGLHWGALGPESYLPVFPWKLWHAARSVCGERQVSLASAGILPIAPKNSSASHLLRRLNGSLSHVPVGSMLALHMRWNGIPLTPSGVVMRAFGGLACGNSASRKIAGCAREAVPPFASRNGAVRGSIVQ